MESIKYGVHLCEECKGVYCIDIIKHKQLECEITKTYLMCFHMWQKLRKPML